MRKLTGLVLLAACSCSSRPPSPPGEPALRLTCDTSVAAYCAANPCNQTLAMAELDKRQCPATMTRCGITTVIAKNSVDISTLSYYRDGELVAIVNHRFPGQQFFCVAGPETLVVPPCNGPSQSLPACP